MAAKVKQPTSKTSKGKQPTSPSQLLSPQLCTDTLNCSPSSFYANDSLEQSFVAQFLEYERQHNETIKDKDLKKFISLPGSTVHPRAEKELIRQSKSKKQKSIPSSSTLRSNSLLAPIQSKKASINNKAMTGQKKKRKKLTPYVSANLKLTRVLQHMKPRGKKENLQSSQLNEFYALVTKETSAAVILQSQCRRVLATAYVKDVAHRTKSATKIQTHTRAFFARMIFKRLRDEKQRATEIRESFVQLFVARYRRRKRILLEHVSTIVCQSTVRMYFAKQEVHMMRLQHSWEVNQHRWRVISTRLSWKHLRSYFYARQIQTMIRRRLAKSRVARLFAEYTKAAIRIQTVWRRFKAQNHKVDVLYQLKIDTHAHKIRIIASEHKHWKQQYEELTKPTKQQAKNELISQKEELEQLRREKYEQIQVLELHYKDQLQIQQQITPRAISGGWNDQVSANLKDTRERITKAKLDLFFNLEKKLKAVQEDVDRIESIENEAQGNMEYFDNWRNVEQEQLWDIQRQHAKKVEKKEVRKRIIDEQLKWQVKFTRPSGKPDKRILPTPPHVDNSTERAQEQLRSIICANHLSNTFNPIQDLIDRCNSLDISAFQESETVYESTSSRHMATSNSNHKQKKQQTRDFPRRIPFKLLEQKRHERKVIHSKYQAAR